MRYPGQQIKQFLLPILQMVRLAWQAQPLFLVTLIFLEVVQGLVPLATAWLTHGIARVVQTKITPAEAMLDLQAAFDQYWRCVADNDLLEEYLLERMVCVQQDS